jgi:hypothetical protein
MSFNRNLRYECLSVDSRHPITRLSLGSATDVAAPARLLVGNDLTEVHGPMQKIRTPRLGAYVPSPSIGPPHFAEASWRVSKGQII